MVINMTLAPETFDFIVQLTGGIAGMGFILSLFIMIGDDTEIFYGKR